MRVRPARKSRMTRLFRLSKTRGIVKGPQSLDFIPAPAARTPKRMKTIWLSHVAAFAAREQSERQTLRKLEKVAVCHFSDTQKSRMTRLLSCIAT
mgnify:FL=1